MMKAPLLTGLLLLLVISACAAVPVRPLRCRVTYCTSAQIYFEGGKEEGLSVGDTLSITRGDTAVGSAMITAIASHSSVGRPLIFSVPPRIGDVGVVMKEESRPVVPRVSADSTAPPVASPILPESEKKPQENMLAGRIVFQYTGQIAEDSRLNINQPSLYARLRLENVEGTGVSLSFYGREYYDIGGPYMRYGDSTHSRFDLSELSVGVDRAADIFGFRAGRFVSRYVPAAGTLDGAEAFARQGRFTAGALAGNGIQSRVTAIGGNQRTTGGFLAYRQDDLSYDAYEASLAYVRQTVGGNLDREFLSMYHSTGIGANIHVYGSADVELKEMNNGVLSARPSLSSLTAFVNYTPAPWLSANFGYDGGRSVYLFESMKNLSDSLYHQALQQGFRLNGTARLGGGYTLTAEGSMNSFGIDGGSSHTLGGGIRVTDIFSARVFGSFRYRNTGGTYLNGSQITAELGRNFFQRLDLQLQYDSRSFAVERVKQTYTTQTFSGNANFWISRNLYGTFGADYVLDNTMNGFRYFLEFGYRF